MKTKNRILINRFTFATCKETSQSVFNVIGLDFDNFIKLDKGCKGYKSRYYFEGVTIAYDGAVYHILKLLVFQRHFSWVAIDYKKLDSNISLQAVR